MKRSYISLFLLLIMVLAGCKTTKKATTTNSQGSSTEVAVAPTWHTCLVQSARATATLGKQSLSVTCTMQAVHDSLVIVSVMPLFGIELYRLEATPTEIIAIDKLNRYYLQLPYSEVNKYVTPQISYRDLQDIASGDILPEGGTHAQLSYSAKGKRVSMNITYPTVQKDIALRLQRLSVDRYSRMDMETLLK